MRLVDTGPVRTELRFGWINDRSSWGDQPPVWKSSFRRADVVTAYSCQSRKGGCHASRNGFALPPGICGAIRSNPWWFQYPEVVTKDLVYSNPSLVRCRDRAPEYSRGRDCEPGGGNQRLPLRESPQAKERSLRCEGADRREDEGVSVVEANPRGQIELLESTGKIICAIQSSLR